MDSLLKLIVFAQFVTFSLAFYDPEIRLEKRRDDGYTDFSPEEVDAIVARHNYHRANTTPSAANMLELVSLKTIFLPFPHFNLIKKKMKTRFK